MYKNFFKIINYESIENANKKLIKINMNNFIKQALKNILLIFLFIIFLFPNTGFAESSCFLTETEKFFKYGDTHEDIRQLQKYLNNNGFLLANTGPGSMGKETNYFGPLTRQALINFQKSKQLNSSGILDQDTKNFLGCKSFFIFNFDFKYGDTHEDIRQLQKYLNNNGFLLANTGSGSMGKETNYFGPLTRQALINFQKSKNLISTGILDITTRQTINNLNNETSAPADTTTENIDTEITAYYSVGGKVSGIVSSIVLKNNKDELFIKVGDDGNFVFPTKLLNGDSYNVSIRNDSYHQNCSINNNVGIIKNANVEDITINCRRIYFGGGGGSSSVVNTYNLAYSANTNGTVSGTLSQTVNQGNSGSEVVAVPDTGYHFVSWSDGVLTAARTDTNVTANIAVSASFAINTYEIVSSAGSNGIITPSGTTTKDYNSSQSYQIEADDGYQVADVLVDGVSVGAIDLHVFSSIQANHTITVSFEAVPISTVTVSTISPSSGYDTKSASIDQIIGTGFRPGISVKLTKTGETDIDCTNVVFESETVISNASCDISLVESGDWNVVLENTDTGSGTLSDGFEVKEYEVGEVGPLGGYIFYVNSNYVADGWKYMEAASADVGGAGAKWADVTAGAMGATGVTVGTGLANTEIVTGSTDPINSAIEYTLNYSTNGIDDWFLPSENELDLMYTTLHLAGKGGFNASSYWSSTEIDATTARRKSFNSGLTSSGSKGTSYRIRPVRRFSTCPTYSIFYDGNGNTGGEVPTDNDSYLTGSNVTVLDENTLVKNGYSFIGWNTSSDGSGTDYATSSTLVMPANGITLYAKWYRPNFTIAIMPDTQSYVNWKKAEMTDQIDWLVDNKDDLNLQFVGHVGDIVQNWDGVPTDWEFAQTEMHKLNTAGIPYSILPGNHDYAYMSRNSTVFNSYFPLSNYSSMTSYGGAYDANSNNQYHILTVDKDNNGTPDDKILVISLEFGPREAVVNWAKSILSANSSTPAIIITHAYLQPDGDLLEYGDNHAASNGYGLGEDVYDGDELWDSLVYPNNNVRFVFSGHDGKSDDGSALRSSNHGDGSPVYQVMANYQYYPVNEAGYLVLLNFTENQVTMKTFSPWTNTYKTDAESQATWDWTPFDFE